MRPLRTLAATRKLRLLHRTLATTLKLPQTATQRPLRTLAGQWTIAKIEALTNVKTLDLSQVSGVTELKLENTTLESISLEGNQSITTVEITGNNTLTTLNVKDCSNLTTLDVKDCSNLRTLYCSSCALKEVRLDGCDRLDTLDCSDNSLMMFNASGLRKLHSLKCENQRIYNKPLSRLMNFLDLLLSRGIFRTSTAEESNGAEILANVRNLKAYDSSDNELSVNLDRESGKVVFGRAPAMIEYDYVTGFKDVMMDVEVVNSETPQETNYPDDENPSIGGCASGFGVGALGVVMLLLASLRKKAA